MQKIDDCVVRTVHMDADMACLYANVVIPYMRHMVAPGDDTCQEDLGIREYSWTYPKVTRVTTRRVTHGTDDVII
jgi:hypothetical protein